jgi:hypothetical protein
MAKTGFRRNDRTLYKESFNLDLTTIHLSGEKEY